MKLDGESKKASEPNICVFSSLTISESLSRIEASNRRLGVRYHLGWCHKHCGQTRGHHHGLIGARAWWSRADNGADRPRSDCAEGTSHRHIASALTVLEEGTTDGERNVASSGDGGQTQRGNRWLCKEREKSSTNV